MFKHFFTPTTLYLRCTVQLHYATNVQDVKMTDKVTTEAKWAAGATKLYKNEHFIYWYLNSIRT